MISQGSRRQNETGPVCYLLVIKRSAAMLPPNEELAICFAHVAYRLHERFSALNSGINSFAVRDPGALEDRVGEADVLVISGMWQNGLLAREEAPLHPGDRRRH
jgi:hypothetical protein